MALTVNTNVLALNAQRHTAATQEEMASAMERLASGKRINSAVDDAAGLAITARMEAQISGLAQAVRNAGDAISLVNTAEGALQETTSILQRIRELAIQSAGGAPSNADRVNLNKEVIQLQEELLRITTTTRFNGELLLNGTFHDKDFQIGQTNNEEISVNIGDLRPERIGAFTQNTLENVGYINVGTTVDSLTNGVNQQTLTVAVGSEVPRIVAINQGDSARVISDKLNQSGAQINSRATTTLDVYIVGEGSFSYSLSSDSAGDLSDVITVGGTAASKAHSMAAEINAKYSDHNISASVEVDEDGTEFVRMHQNQGYNIHIDDFVTAGTSGLDFNGNGNKEITGAAGATAAVIGGQLIIDAPATFLISSDDTENTILVGTRASLEVQGVSSVPTDYQDLSFDVNVSGVSRTITLAAPPPTTPTEATSAVVPMEFTAPAQTQAASGQQIGAFRPATYTIGNITTRTSGDDIGDETTQIKLTVNGVVGNLDIAQALSDMGVESGDAITKSQFISAMQTTVDEEFTGANAVTVSVNQSGQVVFAMADGTGTITVAEHRFQSAGKSETVAAAGSVSTGDDTITITDHEFVSGDIVTWTHDNAGIGIASATTYAVIRVDDNRIQLAATGAPTVALDLTAQDTGTLATAAGDGLAATLIKNTAPTDGSSSETGTSGSVILGESDNVLNGASATDGPVKPFGVTDFVIDGEVSNAIDSTDATVVVVAADTIAIGASYQTGQKLTYNVTNGATAIGGLTDGEDYWVIRVDATTIKLASSYADAVSDIPIDLTGVGTGATDSLVHSNDTFTMAINGGATTTEIDIPDGTYYSVEQLATAIQTSIDNSPFAQTGGFPITASVTEDANGDLGITLASADGHSIQLGGTEFLTDYSAMNVNPAATAPDVGTLVDRTLTVTYGGGSVTGDEKTQLAISVNGSDFIDLDVSTKLNAADVESASVTSPQFVAALQATIDAESIFSGDNALTVSVTSAGLVQLVGVDATTTIAIREHSSQRSSATNGLVETLTGKVANDDHIGTTITDGKASQSTTTGTLILGSEANAAIVTDGNDSTDANYVKTFGIDPIEIDANNQTFSFSVNSGSTSTVTIPTGTYTTMAEIAEALQTVLDIPTDSNQVTGLIDVVSMQNSSSPYGYGLKFSNPDGYSIDYSGSLISDALERAVVTGDVTTGVGTSNIELTGHGFSTGDVVKYSANGGTVLGGLSDENTYYVIRVDKDNFQLATSSANATAGTEIDFTGTGNNAQAFGLSTGTVAELTGAPAGPAASRTSVIEGVYSNGIDLSADNVVTLQVMDGATGDIDEYELTLASSSASVSFSDYADLIASAANLATASEGFSFTASGTGSSLEFSMDPAGPYTVTLSGTSVTQGFGGAVSGAGEASNMDGYVFESMNDVVEEMNREFEAAGLGLVATYSRGGDTFNFAVTEGRADASNTLAFSGDALADVGFSGDLTSVGGGTEPTETVRYVSQIDISTRDSALLSMTVVDAALETLAANRAGLGAVANRLESTISNLMNISENTAESMSRVMDADFAAESTRLARAQILQEASVAMLAQANAAAQTVLKLLQ